jgi:hypothetical protein
MTELNAKNFLQAFGLDCFVERKKYTGIDKFDIRHPKLRHRVVIDDVGDRLYDFDRANDLSMFIYWFGDILE